jgi:uncharacterized protein (DUF433 family)
VNTEAIVRNEDGDLFVGASRITLHDIVSARQRGLTPEEIQDDFPGLSLLQVYAAIVYYLEHQEALDTAFAEDQRLMEERRAETYSAHADFYDAMRLRFKASISGEEDETSPQEASQG